MKTKELFIICGLLFLASCSTFKAQHGYYSIKAYDVNGHRLDEINISTERSKIQTSITTYCLTFPSATLIIENARTGKELSEGSPYQCKSQKAGFIHHNFIAPKNIDFNGITYTQADSIIEDINAVYEYRPNNESIGNSTKQVNLFYNKIMDENSPNGFIKESIKTYGRLFGSSITSANGYTAIISNPSNKQLYYLSAVSKSFHQEKCAGRVIYQYVEIYPKDTRVEKIQDNIKNVVYQLRDYSWLPNCGH